jgi:hypothetical protein
VQVSGNLSGGDRIELIERPSPNITASAPVTAQQGTGVHVFAPGITKLSTTWTYERRKPSGHLTSGEVLLNTNLYNDGVLYRFDHHWEADFPYDDVYRYNGYSAVKTMALISETKIYDTFLASTKGGALYTIHIPKNAALKPVVTKIRSRRARHAVGGVQCGAV